MRPLRIFILGVLILLIMANGVLAATLEGRVLCDNGSPLPGPVQITIAKSGGAITVDTNSYGQYSVSLEPGRYVFTINEKRFQVYVYPQNAPRDFYLPCR